MFVQWLVHCVVAEITQVRILVTTPFQRILIVIAFWLFSSISGDVKRLVSDVKSVVICLTGKMDCCTHLFILHNIGWDGVSEV